MKRHNRNSFKWQQKQNEKNKEKTRRQEQKASGFRCSHCKYWVVIDAYIGTSNRNHCNSCLWSRHVDEKKGDRKATCHAGMQPIGLTFKHEGYSKQGELMLIHQCVQCQKISINRIARDDNEPLILEIFEASLRTNHLEKMGTQNIRVLAEKDREEIQTQLFGK